MSQRPHDPVIDDPRRLAAVRATGLLDTRAEEPFDRLARLAAQLLDAPMAFVTVVDENRSFWKSAIGVDLDDPADRQNTVEESFCQYVVRSGDKLIAGDAANNELTRDNPSVEGMGVRAWAGFPVRAPGGEALGSFCVVDTKPRVFDAAQIKALETLSEAASAEIALRMNVQELAELNETLRQSLLPPMLPSAPGLDLAARFVPAADGQGVLGDFYDAFEGADGRWWFVLGDVCGHGPSAAETTSLARWSIRANAPHTDDPKQLAGLLNAQLLGRATPEAPHAAVTIATCVPTDRLDGAIDVEMVVAGQPPALVRNASGQVRPVEVFGNALGWFDEPVLGCTTVRIEQGATLLLQTDGAVEARREAATLGLSAVSATVAAAGPSSRSVVDAVVDAVTVYADQADDDLALLAITNPA